MRKLATIPCAHSLTTVWSAISNAAVQISERPVAGAVTLKAGRCVNIARTLVQETQAAAPPPNTWAANGNTLWLWQGPREWLMMSEAVNGPALAERTARLMRHVTAAVLNITDKVLQLDVSGHCATHLFAKGTSLDPALLPAGGCCRTRFANLQATVVRYDSTGHFNLITDRSTALYLHEWLRRAVADLD